MSNVLDELLNSISPAVAARAAALIGEPLEPTNTSIRLAAAAVLAGVRGAARDGTHGPALLSLLVDKANEASGLATPAGYFANGASRTALAGLADKALTTVFGANREAVSKEIAAAGGISAGAARLLLGHVTPHVFALLGRDLRASGDTTVAGLTHLLDAQRPSGYAASLLPSHLAKLIGSPSTLAVGAAAAATVAASRFGWLSTIATLFFGFPAWLRWLVPLFVVMIGSGWLLGRQTPAPVAAKVAVAQAPAVEAPKASAPVAAQPKAVVEPAPAPATLTPGVTTYFAPTQPFTAETYYNKDYVATAETAVAEVAAPVVEAVPVAVPVAADAPAAPTPGVTTFFPPTEPFKAETYYNADYVAPVAAPAVVAAAEPIAAPIDPTPGVTTFFAPTAPFTAETYYNPDYVAPTAAPVAVAEAKSVAAPIAPTPGVTTFFAPTAPFTAETYYNPDYVAPTAAPAVVAAPIAPTPGVTTFFAPTAPFTAETYYNPDYVAPKAAPVVAAAVQAPTAAPAKPVPGVTTYFAPTKPFTAPTYINPDYVAKAPAPARVAVAAPAPAAVVQNCQSAVTAAVKPGEIHFQTASAKLADASRVALDRLVAAIKSCPGVRLRIEGHTDADGRPERNQTLSENRANTVANYLSEAGIDAKRLTPVGFGQDKPIAPNDTAEAKAQNRRIELIVEKL